MPLSPAIAGWLRDAVHAAEISLNQSPDASILALAARERRVIITADLDFPRLLATLGTTATGLILLRGGNYSEAERSECVRRVLMAVTPDELKRSIVVVDKQRIRKRPLPI